MKTTLLFLSVFVTSLCLGQASVFETIPSTGGTNTTLRAPNGTASHTSLRAHYLIPASELSSLPSGIDIIAAAYNLLSGTNAAANGNLKFYMENTTATSNTKSTTWTTAIATMDTVYDATFTIPNSTTATQALLVLSDTFTYTGGGIYIAYEYIGASFGTTSAVYDCNNSIPGALKMVSNTTTTPGATLTGTSSWRPILTIEYVNPFTNDMVVDNLTLELGHPNKINDTSQTVIGIVRNKSSVGLTSIPVTLTITGANPSADTIIIPSIPAGGSYPLIYSNLSTATSGSQTIKLSVPSDQFTPNDSLQLVQIVSCDTLSYLENTAPYTAIGFNTGGGILAAKHKGSSTKNTTVKTIYANVDANTNITGNQLQALLLDTGGVILDSSAIVTISASQLGKKIEFPLTGNNVITPANPDYFIGIRQYPNATTGYYPLSSHNPTRVPSDRYFSFNMNGSGQSSSYTTLGTLGIGALIEVEKITLANSDANDSICGAENITFTASGTSSALYNFKSGGTSLQNTASNTYMSNVSITTTISVEGMHNTCPIFSNTSSINVIVVDGSASKTDDSTTMATASGASYQWLDCGTGTVVAGATSQTFVASVSGSYQVVVTQNGCSDTSTCFSLVVPVAGINENNIASLKVYPSPVNSLLTVETDYTQIISLTLTNVDGKLINAYSPNNRKAQIDVSNLPTGIYLLNIVSEKGNETRRFIKQ